MTKEEIIDNIARLNSETWRDREEVRTEIGKLLGELKKALEQPTSDDCVSRQSIIDMTGLSKWFESSDDYNSFVEDLCKIPPVTPTQRWIPLVWDEYPIVDSDGNDDYIYAVDYSVPMPKEDEWVLITDENRNVVKVQYDGYDFGDYARENILAWQPLPKAYEDK